MRTVFNSSYSPASFLSFPATVLVRTKLKEIKMQDELFARGEQIRAEVLGAEYVASSTANTDAFSEPMREFAIRNLWGDVWARPGLDRRSRSIVNLALLSAANRPGELKTHIRAALNNGVKREEIGEIFLQVALYAGVPTGSEATRVAKQTFAEIDAQAKA